MGTDARQRAQNVVNFDREKLEGIVIQNGDDKIELKRLEGKWRIEAPFKDQADSGAIESLLANLEDWQKQDTIPAEEIENGMSRHESWLSARCHCPPITAETMTERFEFLSLSLPLFVAWVLGADHAHDVLALHDFARFTKSFY